MSRRFRGWASVDDQGRLVFDPHLVDRLGLLPGTTVSLEIEEGEIRLSRPVTRENARLYPGGGVSPCLPLLHTHTSYWEGRPRLSRRCTTGSLEDRSQEQIWNDLIYVAFRQKVQEFDFSPCILCWNCELSDTNEEDCIWESTPHLRRLPLGAGGISLSVI